MAEIDELMKLVKQYTLGFPVKVGILSKSVREISEAGEDMRRFITSTTRAMMNAEELENWLNDNKDKKHIILMPVSAGRIAAAKKTNAILKKVNPAHYSQAKKGKKYYRLLTNGRATM